MPTLQEACLITNQKCADLKEFKNLNVNTLKTMQISL